MIDISNSATKRDAPAPIGRPAFRKWAGLALALALCLTMLSLSASGAAPERMAREAVPGSSAGEVVVRIPLGRLAVLREGDPAHSFGGVRLGRAQIGWSHQTHLGEQRALLWFDLGGIPSRAQVARARLVAGVESASGLDAMAVQASPVLGEWVEGSASWQGQPAMAEVGATALLGAGGAASWDITEWTRQWVAEPAHNWGLMLVSRAAYPEDNLRVLSGFELEIALAADSLSLSLSDRVDPVRPGDYVEYELELHNAGAAASLNPVLEAQLPAEARFMECTDGCRHQDGAVTWLLPDLPAGASYRVYLTARVTDAAVPGSVLSMMAQAAALNSPAPAQAQEETGIVGAPATGTPTATPSGDECQERVANGGFEDFTTLG